MFGLSETQTLWLFLAIGFIVLGYQINKLIAALRGPGRQLAEYGAVQLNFGDAIGEECPDFLIAGKKLSARIDGDGLVGVFACRVAETVGRVVNHQKTTGPYQGLEEERTLLEALEGIVAKAAQHGHAEDRIEPAQSAQDTVARIDEADSISAVLPGFEQVHRIDVGADDLGFRKVLGERDAFLSGRAPERENAACVGCRGGGGGENHRVPIERGPVRPLVAAEMEQRGHLRELAALKVMKDAFSTHAAP
jgi:hypothetical protein